MVRIKNTNPASHRIDVDWDLENANGEAEICEVYYTKGLYCEVLAPDRSTEGAQDCDYILNEAPLNPCSEYTIEVYPTTYSGEEVGVSDKTTSYTYPGESLNFSLRLS